MGTHNRMSAQRRTRMTGGRGIWARTVHGRPRDICWRVRHGLSHGECDRRHRRAQGRATARAAIPNSAKRKTQTQSLATSRQNPAGASARTGRCEHGVAVTRPAVRGSDISGKLGTSVAGGGGGGACLPLAPATACRSPPKPCMMLSAALHSPSADARSARVAALESRVVALRARRQKRALVECAAGGGPLVHAPAPAEVPAHPEVRLVSGAEKLATPSDIEASILRPAGVNSVVAILAVGAAEVRILFDSWDDAYAVLRHCKHTQRTLQVCARPGARGPVAHTKTQVARFAAAEVDSRSPPRSPPGNTAEPPWDSGGPG